MGEVIRLADRRPLPTDRAITGKGSGKRRVMTKSTPKACLKATVRAFRSLDKAKMSEATKAETRDMLLTRCGGCGGCWLAQLQ
jgi:hypothetical protein